MPSYRLALIIIKYKLSIEYNYCFQDGCFFKLYPYNILFKQPIFMGNKMLYIKVKKKTLKNLVFTSKIKKENYT